ncbi:MAG: GDYXXLXY domain-containing protein, partial [Gammaproteobacteria bacterium]|nr:GDYXXLXY domain-containing protein [Gammaproteobacteria bacterium]
MRSVTMIVIISGLLFLFLINAKIVEKETLLKEGEVVYLELAPVDPRSLMQG